MKSRQFCSVCKEWLDMEVVPTTDGDEDDGVIWFRCPQCQGFLPKLSGADLKDDEAADSGEAKEQPAAAASNDLPAETDVDEAMPWDSPADMMAAQSTKAEPAASPFLPEDDDEAVGVETPATKEDSGADSVFRTPADKAGKAEDQPPESTEPIHEYAAMLAALDVGESKPYRPWESYETGQCIHHLAWEDCGVVVAKEELPGGRKVIKCYFEDAGVVRLIEQAPK